MPFWTYDQNNTGGSFDYDADRGITHYVIVEGRDAADADARAERAGLYWDGCDDGRDCSCCGDRWSTAWGPGDAEPTIYGKPALSRESRWMAPGEGVAIHYIDGRIVWPGRTEAA